MTNEIHFTGILTQMQDSSYINKEGQLAYRTVIRLVSEERCPQSLTLNLFGSIRQQLLGLRPKVDHCCITAYLNLTVMTSATGHQYQNIRPWKLEVTPDDSGYMYKIVDQPMTTASGSSEMASDSGSELASAVDTEMPVDDFNDNTAQL